MPEHSAQNSLAGSKDYAGLDYREFWTGPEKVHVDGLERKIVRRVLPGGGIFAEIGSGYGRLADCYLDRFDKSYMVEPADNLRALAERDYGRRAECVNASVYELPFADGTCDAILMVRVMHHLVDEPRALTELHRTIKPGGVLLFTYSNKRNPARIAKFALGRADNPFSVSREAYTADTLFGHHPKLMESMARRAGFVIKRRYGVGLVAKVAGVLPFLAPVLPATLAQARLAGALDISPTIFLLARKKQ